MLFPANLVGKIRKSNLFQKNHSIYDMLPARWRTLVKHIANHWKQAKRYETSWIWSRKHFMSKRHSDFTTCLKAQAGVMRSGLESSGPKTKISLGIRLWGAKRQRISALVMWCLLFRLQFGRRRKSRGEKRSWKCWRNGKTRTKTNEIETKKYAKGGVAMVIYNLNGFTVDSG